jgi:F1F0 ATPase subunit 2
MMNPSETLVMGLAFAGGVVLGSAFHAGLWWTVVRGLDTHRSALWFPGSALLRMGGTVVVFYLIGAGHPQRFVACLAGFILAQVLVTGFAARTGRRIDHAS